jgi:hypothetical protein
MSRHNRVSVKKIGYCRARADNSSRIHNNNNKYCYNNTSFRNNSFNSNNRCSLRGARNSHYNCNSSQSTKQIWYNRTNPNNKYSNYYNKIRWKVLHLWNNMVRWHFKIILISNNRNNNLICRYRVIEFLLIVWKISKKANKTNHLITLIIIM